MRRFGVKAALSWRAQYFWLRSADKASHADIPCRFCWRAQGKVHVGPESAALEFHWRAQRKVCVGLGSAALTRVIVLGNSSRGVPFYFILLCF